jgi:hypothetical protein
MTNPNRQQSLAAARRACLLLAEYAVGDSILLLGDIHREAITCLLEEFGRLDANAQRVGRKRIENPKKTTVYQRRWRDKHK